MSKNKRLIITIAGRPGSGKSKTASKVAKNLNYRHFSSGDLFRSFAKEQGLDLLKANISAKQNTSIDHKIDNELIQIGKNQNQLVIDSRMAWHWIPDSFKVFLDLDTKTAAKRILLNKDTTRLDTENIPNDDKQYAKILDQRQQIESDRYKNLYNADPYQLKNYDLIVDTKLNDIDQVAIAVVSAYKNWLKS